MWSVLFLSPHDEAAVGGLSCSSSQAETFPWVWAEAGKSLVRWAVPGVEVRLGLRSELG